MPNMCIVWFVAAIVFAVIEAVSYQLVSIWFTGGCIAALIALVINPELSLTAQLAICVIVSAVLLIATRPFVKKMQNSEKPATNIDALIGKNAVVTERIDNVKATGEVKLDGKLWSARSTDDTVIENDSIVAVEKIDGVKVIVKIKG